MLEFNAAAFYWAVNSIDSIRAYYGKGVLKSTKLQPDGSVLIGAVDPVVLNMMKDIVSKLRASLEELGAEVTLLAVDDLEVVTNGDLPTYESIRNVVDQIDITLKRELKTIRVLVVERNDRDLYDPKDPPFGVKFNPKFVGCAYDLEEAGKCLSLGRSTASAFHSLRILEAGVYALSRSLSIPDPIKGADRTWGKMLNLIRDELENRWPAKSGRVSGDARVFDDIYGALAGMQNPYRNSTMHLADKYTPEEARHIYELVRGLMMRLTDRMNQDGLPLA